MAFNLTSKYKPTGDQPQAIKQLIAGVRNDDVAQVLLGVTGSGKTFTMANVIAELNKPVLVLTHNKTLTAQLYSEFTEFFPDNAVEYFVSYYDYYQPEAYISYSDTYIEKDLSINEQDGILSSLQVSLVFMEWAILRITKAVSLELRRVRQLPEITFYTTWSAVCIPEQKSS